MGKNKFARKLCAGFVLFILVMSVFSGAISATDMNTSDLAIDESSMMQNEGFDDKDSKPLSYALPQTRVGVLSYSYESDLLRITVGERESSGWHYQYDPVGDPENFIRSVYGEHYAVATDTWGSVIRSNDFTIDTYFGSEEASDTATLHYGNLSLTRQVTPPEGSARSFSITFVLTNIGDSTLENVRFFQGVDYDIKDSGNDYAWYTEATDTVWQNDDSYFKNGFHGSRPSSHHDCNRYGSMWSDMHSGQLNDLPKYPEAEGETKDCGIALQWDAGDLLPQASWDLTITFYFGEAAGIEANAGPDQTVGCGQPVTFDASRSSSVSTITTYEWDFDNDGVYDVSVSSQIYEYEGWTELGEYIVGLQVTDDEGRNDTDTVKMTVVPNVDLIVTNITFTPTEINDGDIMIFNATVENIGTEALTDDFYVRFEVDENYIGRQQVSGGLAAGNSVHVLQNWEADAGTHTVRVYADRGYYSSQNNLIPETNETNNTLSQALPEILHPDLTITSLTWSPTEGIGDGDIVIFNATVNNTGAGNTTSDFYVRFEIDGSCIGGQRVSGLAAGGSTEVSQSWHADAGTHNVKAVVDYYNRINESTENNNELSHALPEIPFPDLTITDISWSPATDIKHGDTVTFTATIENIEAGNTSRNFYVLFEIDGSYIGHRRVSGLTAGSSTEVMQDWTADAGTHTVKAIVDEYDSVNESIESNNDKSEALPEIPQPPQVNVTSPNGSEVWYGAQDITWEATSPDGLDLTMKIELYNGYSYKLIADGLPNTGTYQNWDTAKFADGSPVPDGTYYKIRITATDTAEVSGSDLSDNWFTIWNMPIVEISSAPYSQTTTESVNATYYLTIVNKQPSADTFDLLVDNTDNAAVAELSQSSITLDPWRTGTVTLNITDETSGTYRVTVRAVSQTDSSVTDEVTITTYVRDAFTIAVSAPRTQASIGGTLTYKVEIANNQGTSDTFMLTVTGIEESWFSIVSSCQLTAGETKTIPLEILVPDTASAGEFSLTIQATSSNLGTVRETSAPLNVSAAPLIFDLIPADNTRTGAAEVLFCWRTSVNSTSDVFIKAESEADYTLVSNVSGIFHAVPVSGLSRNIWYAFYVRSNSTHGSATSEVRSIFIDNGITFSQRNYEFTIERDYNQERTITIINTDDEPHEVLLNVSGVPEDLALNFVGEGSMDQVIPLFPGESKNIAIVFHAQDAQAEEYNILFNLTNLGAEEISDFAYLKLHVHFPVIDFTIEEISSDPHTLAKTIKITNSGDPLTDLSISASDELSSILMFQPSIDHAYLGTGRSVTFDAIPVLSEGFTGASGTIDASAAGEEQSLSVDFGCSDGKQIFIGRSPNYSISFNEVLDSDGNPNTNPLAGEPVDSYVIDDADKAKRYSIIVGVKVRQDGKPISNADVSLRVWNPESEFVINDACNLLGDQAFVITGPAGNYFYQAELVGYGAATEVRGFSINETSKFTVSPFGINWTSISDSDSTFDLTGVAPDEIELDNSPFSFEATYDGTIEEGTTALLYLQPVFEDIDEDVLSSIRRILSVNVWGEIDDNTLSFTSTLVPIGNWTATIVLYHPSIDGRFPLMPMAFSTQINLTFSEDYAGKQLDYALEKVVQINSTTYGLGLLKQQTLVTDPRKTINLYYVDTTSSDTDYLFTYIITANETMDDNIIIEVKDGNDQVIYSDIRPIHLEANVNLFIEVPVPKLDAEGEPIVDYNISIMAQDVVLVEVLLVITLITVGAHLSYVDNIESKTFPQCKKVGIVKCAAGLIPVVGWPVALGAGVTDLILANSGEAPSSGGWGVWGAGLATNEGVYHCIRGMTAKAGTMLSKAGYVAGGIGSVYEAEEVYGDFITGRVKAGWNAIKAGLRNLWRSILNQCINGAPVTIIYLMPSSVPPTISPTQNVEGVFVTCYFPRETPNSYQPFDTILYLNGHEIGRINDAVPQGYYTFEADPSWLNYAEAGVAENTVTLDVEGMNRGYYVPIQGIEITILFKQLSQAVCAASQAEADQIVANLSTAMAHQADFAVCSPDISFSELQPGEGENVTIEATIHNLESKGEIDVDVQFLDNDIEIDNLTILYLPEFSSQTVSTNWTATEGTHNIQIKVNPDRELNESDYTNNEASKTITVTAPDATKPEISNPQPPDGYTTSDNTPLISADLADADSGINTTAVRITVDDFDVTQNATVISSRVWYTPELALANDVHNVSVYAEDNKGNNDSLDWSFTVAAEIILPDYDVELTVEGAKTAAKTTSPGENATYMLMVKNNGTLADSYTLTVDNPDGAAIASLNTYSITNLAADTAQSVLLNVTDETEATYRVNVTVISENDPENATDFVNTTTTVGAAVAVCGDVTGDERVRMGDARRIVMWLSYPDQYPIHNLWAADVTGDGKVRMGDARRIVMWLSYPDDYPLTCCYP